jgi:hypothetical protein
VSPAPAREDPHDLGDEDLSPLRPRAEPRRLDERHAVGMRALPRDVARADPDADADPRHVGAPARGLDRLLDRDRRRHRVGRAGERRHDAVAEIVVERAAVLRDRVGQEAVVYLPALLGALLAQLDTPGRRRHQVGEEDRGRAGGPAAGCAGIGRV